MPMLRNLIRPRRRLSPVSRVAIAAFVWAHRHEIMRWGRSLAEQVIGRQDVSPARAARTGRVLFVIASDERLRDARQLRKVTMTGDDVELSVDERWSELPRLIDQVRSVKGVRHVFVNGNPEVGSLPVSAAS